MPLRHRCRVGTGFDLSPQKQKLIVNQFKKGGSYGTHEKKQSGFSISPFSV